MRAYREQGVQHGHELARGDALRQGGEPHDVRLEHTRFSGAS
jgi:hypothetical protein